MTGMKVLEFGIGIPPKMKKLFQDKKGTEYTLNWLPIGGFVRIKGEDPASPEASDIDAFSAKRWWARSVVLIAGVTMNFLLAFVIFFVFFLTSARPLSPNFLVSEEYGSYFLPSVNESLTSGYLVQSGVELTPLSGSLAEIAGIRPGDIVKKVNTTSITQTEAFKKMISENTTVTLILEGTGGERSISMTPKDGKIVVYITNKNLSINEGYHQDFTVTQALTTAGHEVYALSRMTVDVLGSTFSKLAFPKTSTERKEASEMLSGPIGIGAGFVGIAEVGVTPYILFMIIAMLSINLGVINILPFPALDGGRLFSTSVIALVSLFTKKMNLLVQVERFIHGFGMILLLTASVAIAFMDVLKIW